MTRRRRTSRWNWRLRVLESAPAPRTTVQNPLRWPGSATLARRLSEPGAVERSEIERERADFVQQAAIAKALR